MFPEYVQPPGTFNAGMKIEAVDPLNLASVCVATVMQVRFHLGQKFCRGKRASNKSDSLLYGCYSSGICNVTTCWVVHLVFWYSGMQNFEKNKGQGLALSHNLWDS